MIKKLKNLKDKGKKNMQTIVKLGLEKAQKDYDDFILANLFSDEKTFEMPEQVSVYIDCLKDKIEFLEKENIEINDSGFKSFQDFEEFHEEQIEVKKDEINELAENLCYFLKQYREVVKETNIHRVDIFKVEGCERVERAIQLLKNNGINIEI